MEAEDTGSGTTVSKLERYLPVAYLLIGLAIVAALLPTVLRPAVEQPNETAQISPDSPPDPEQESIIESLGAASSGTAGSGTGVGVAEEAAGAGPTTTLAPDVPAPAAPPRACPNGVGNPPRQVFSVYAAPCSAPFQGDNGGATYRGVTKDEVRWGFTQCTDLVTPTYEGPVPQNPPPPGTDENAKDRTIRILQQYINTRYQLFGRRLQLYFNLSNGECASDKMRAKALTMIQEYKVFGYTSTVAAGNDEAVRNTLAVTVPPGAGLDYFKKNAPYVHSFDMDSDRLYRLTHELVCKQLVDKPAIAGGDLVKGKPRKIVSILELNETFTTTEAQLQDYFMKACGKRYDDVFVLDVAIPFEDSVRIGQQQFAQWNAQGVTTIADYINGLANAVFTPVATSVGWFPEWFKTSTQLMDDILWGEVADQNQWKSAFGLHASEMDRKPFEADYYRAYKEIDPAGTPDAGMGTYFNALIDIANGIQQAGPKLTPATLLAGLQRQPPVVPNKPIGSLAGQYGPGGFTYVSYGALTWWDPTAFNAIYNLQGAYRHINGGLRYTFGQIPTGPQKWFVAGEGLTRPPGGSG
jgi:hypothetical protein